MLVPLLLIWATIIAVGISVKALIQLSDELLETFRDGEMAGSGGRDKSQVFSAFVGAVVGAGVTGAAAWVVLL